MGRWDREAGFLQRVAREAGTLTLDYFGKITEWDVKTGRGDIVTAADHAVEDLVVDRLHREFPDHGLLTEERGWVEGRAGEPVWVLDPVDGTRNFALGVPIYCVSLAFSIEQVPVLGAIYDPVHDEMFFSKRDAGAWRNDHRISVSSTLDLQDAVVSVSWSPHRRDTNLFNRTMMRVNKHTTYFRRIGSAAIVMSYVASGRFDAYIQAGINPWDIAAGLLLVREAGGVVTDFGGNPIELFSQNIDLVASNPQIHPLLVNGIMAD